MCKINILVTRDVCIICWKEIIIFKRVLMKSIMPREIKDEYKIMKKSGLVTRVRIIFV